MAQQHRAAAARRFHQRPQRPDPRPFALLSHGIDLANPLAGLISLTVMLGILFLVTGILRLIWAFRLGQGTGRGSWILLLSGLVSAGLGLWVLLFPAQTAPVLLGTLIAIELLSAGAALIALQHLGASADADALARIHETLAALRR